MGRRKQTGSGLCACGKEIELEFGVTLLLIWKSSEMLETGILLDISKYPDMQIGLSILSFTAA